MTSYSKQFEVLWADIDLNGHLEHTSYSRYATNVRVDFFKDILDIDLQKFNEQSLGPIVIREFIEYRREVRLGDTIEIDMALAGISEDYSRWVVRHQVYVRGKISCTIHMEGAWLDLNLRKVGTPRIQVAKGFDQIIKTKEFKIIGRRDRLSMTI